MELGAANYTNLMDMYHMELEDVNVEDDNLSEYLIQLQLIGNGNFQYFRSNICLKGQNVSISVV